MRTTPLQIVALTSIGTVLAQESTSRLGRECLRINDNSDGLGLWAETARFGLVVLAHSDAAEWAPSTAHSRSFSATSPYDSFTPTAKVVRLVTE